MEAKRRKVQFCLLSDWWRFVSVEILSLQQQTDGCNCNSLPTLKYCLLCLRMGNNKLSQLPKELVWCIFVTLAAWNKPRTSVWQVGQMSNKVGCALIEYWTPFVRFPLLNSRFIQNIWIRSQYWAELLLCPSLKGHFFRTVCEQESAFHKSTSPASWPAGACYLYSLVLWQKFLEPQVFQISFSHEWRSSSGWSNTSLLENFLDAPFWLFCPWVAQFWRESIGEN